MDAATAFAGGGGSDVTRTGVRGVDTEFRSAGRVTTGVCSVLAVATFVVVFRVGGCWTPVAATFVVLDVVFTLGRADAPPMAGLLIVLVVVVFAIVVGVLDSLEVTTRTRMKWGLLRAQASACAFVSKKRSTTTALRCAAVRPIRRAARLLFT
ncbi:MAG TPA: hypothetical protein VG095_09580 [Chthoniobacterales bacterium]|nr:hypothetical protein [Chthoniobacterales bacterium]